MRVYTGIAVLDTVCCMSTGSDMMCYISDMMCYRDST